MKFNTIKFKTSILYSSILCIILVVYSIVLILEVQNELQGNIDRNLKIKAMEMAGIMNAYEQVNRNHTGPFDMMNRFFHANIGSNNRKILDELWQSQAKALNLENDYINVINVDRAQLLLSKNFKGEIKALFNDILKFSTEEEYYRTLRSDGYNLRAINYPFIFKSNVRFAIQIGTSREYINKTVFKIALFMALVTIVMVLITSFMGHYLVNKILRPVVTVTRNADSISIEDLSRRIDSRNVDEEMKPLIDSFNSMIERLDGSFGHISDFSSHVAHEIKTPLAIIKGELELALMKDRDSEEYKRVMLSLLEEVERVRRIIHDLLLLSKYDYNAIFKFESINIVSLLKELHEEVKVLAIPKNLNVKFSFIDEDLHINGDKVHLRRLFLNLVNNAIKYTPENGTLEITISRDGDNACIAITDTGDGISEENLPRVFDKFFRVNRGPGAAPGSGLGLSIALSIARSHKGNISVTSKLNSGSTFTVTLPLHKFFS